MRPRFARAHYRMMALLAIAALLSLSLLASLPHPWHEERGSRACAICLAYHVPCMVAVSPLQVEQPAADAWQPPVPDSPPTLSPVRIALKNRSPPC